MTTVTRKSRRIILGFAATCIWAAVGATFFQTVQLAAKAPMTVLLTTEPKVIKIRAGNRPLYDGKYQQTPVEIALPPGRHRLKISREGFIPHDITVEGSSLQKIDIDHVLEQSPRSAIGTLFIDHSDQDEPLYVELEDGLASGMTPLTVDSMLIGKDYDISVFPDWPEKSNAARCRAKVTTSPDGTDLEMRRLRSGKVRFSGCRTLRKTKK